MIMLNKVYNFVKKYNMLNRGETVLCGLSGGADSVALLLILNELSETLGIKVEAVHVNHGMRKEAHLDEVVHDLAKVACRAQVPCGGLAGSNAVWFSGVTELYV